MSKSVPQHQVSADNWQAFCLSVRSFHFHTQHHQHQDHQNQHNHHEHHHHYHHETSSDAGDIYYRINLTSEPESGQVHLFSFDRSDESRAIGNCCAPNGLITNDQIINGNSIGPAHCPAQMRAQDPRGIRYDPNDYVMFVTDLIKQSSHAGVIMVTINIMMANGDRDDDDDQQLGSAKLFMCVHSGTHGQQRAPIVCAKLGVPIGEIGVDYLIVRSAITSPVGRAAKRFVPPQWLTSKPLQMAHRGAGSGVRVDLEHEQLLENTIASFNYSVDHGADFVELDLFVSRDGVPAVFHDFTIDIVNDESKQIVEVHCDELTIDELRAIKKFRIKQVDGTHLMVNVDELSADNRPFQTLEEILARVRTHAGICVEFKWPQMFANGTMEARKHHDINDYADQVLQVLQDHANDRAIILQTFEPDLAILLRMKQTKYPVIFLSEGVTNLYEPYADPRSRNVINGIAFARAFDLAGVNLLANYYLNDAKNQLVNYIHNHDMVAHAWGEALNSRSTIQRLTSSGLDSVVYDHIDRILRE